MNYMNELEITLKTPRRDYGLLAKLLFVTMDLIYGKKRTLSKFKVLEIIARVPYQAWEQVAYVAMTHRYRTPHFARRIFEFVSEARHQQDNEQWHLLILEEMIQKNAIRENMVLYQVIPQIIAFVYYHVSWILYVIRPSLSYQLNADFEDHAEHEYMAFVQENPQFQSQPFESDFKKEYGSFNSVADLMIQIGIDERQHKLESIRHIANPRFS